MKRAGVLACCMVLVAGCRTDGNNTFRISAQPASSGAEWWSALYQTTGARRMDGNQLQLVLNGAVFDVLESEISKATQSVNVVLFIWRSGQPSDRIVRVLTERARAGVKCRVLVDPVGSTDFESKVKPALINYDPLSFNLLEEGSLVTDDRSIAQALQQTFNDDLRYAKEVHR